MTTNDSLTTSPTPSHSASPPSSLSSSPPNTTTTTTSLSEDKTLQVWIPYAFFLLSIFVILAVSFVKHTKRVLRRRRTLLDYLEADVLYRRPRIRHMFSSTPRGEGARALFPSCSMTSPSHRPPYGSHFSAGPFGQRRDQASGSSPQFLSVPALRGGLYGGRGEGSERGDEWFHDGSFRGESNLAFSFDEDLGRSHVKSVRSPLHAQRLPGAELHLGHVLSNGYIPQPSHPGSQRSRGGFNTSVFNTSSSSSNSGTVFSEHGRSKDPLTADDIQNVESSPPRSVSSNYLVKCERDPLNPSRTTSSFKCSHCGSVLKQPKTTHSKHAGPRPKTKPRYKRQSACSDSFEMSPAGSDVIRPPERPVGGESETSLSSARAPSNSAEEEPNTRGAPSQPLRKSGSADVPKNSVTFSDEIVFRPGESPPSETASSTRSNGAERRATFKGLGMFSVDVVGGAASLHGGTCRQTSLPESEHGPRTPTKVSLRRTSSAYLPSAEQRTVLTPPSKPHPLPEATTTTLATAAATPTTVKERLSPSQTRSSELLPLSAANLLTNHPGSAKSEGQKSSASTSPKTSSSTAPMASPSPRAAVTSASSSSSTAPIVWLPRSSASQQTLV